MQARRDAGAAELATTAPEAKKAREGDAKQAMVRHVRVLYHYPCIDGVCAALAAHLGFRDQHDVDVRYVPHSSFKPLVWRDTDLFTAQTEVFLLDYCGPTDFIPEVAKHVKKVTLIDHHKTAVEILAALREKNQLPSNVEIHLEMDYSGASLALKFFNPTIADEALKKKIATMYSYVEDHDLWRHKLPFSKEFASGVASRKLEYSQPLNPHIFDQLLKLEPEELIEAGKRTLAAEEEIFTSELAKSFTVSLGPGEQFGRCLGVVTAYAELRSEMGNRLAAKSQKAGLRAIGLLAYQEAGMPDLTMYKVSLRSIGEEDTTVISSAFGGGGHKNASSFLC